MHAPQRRQLVLERLAYQRVREPQLAGNIGLQHQPGADCLVESVQRVADRVPGDLRDDRGVELRSGDRRHRQQLPGKRRTSARSAGRRPRGHPQEPRTRPRTRSSPSARRPARPRRTRRDGAGPVRGRTGCPASARPAAQPARADPRRSAVAACRVDERLNARAVKTANRQPLNTLLATQVREHLGQWMRALQLGVAVSPDDQDPRRAARCAPDASARRASPGPPSECHPAPARPAAAELPRTASRPGPRRSPTPPPAPQAVPPPVPAPSRASTPPRNPSTRSRVASSTLARK